MTTADPAVTAEALLDLILTGDALARLQARNEAERHGLAGVAVLDRHCTLRGRPKLWTLADFAIHIIRTVRVRPHNPADVELGEWSLRETGEAW